MQLSMSLLRFGHTVLLALPLSAALCACVPREPGANVVVHAPSKNCEHARNEAMAVLMKWKHELIFAPDPGYPIDVSRFEFNGPWADAKLGNVYFAAAILRRRPTLEISINNSLKTCGLGFSIGYTRWESSRTNFAADDQPYAVDLIDLLTNHYGEARIKVTKEGW